MRVEMDVLDEMRFQEFFGCPSNSRLPNDVLSFLEMSGYNCLFYENGRFYCIRPSGAYTVEVIKNGRLFRLILKALGTRLYNDTGDDLMRLMEKAWIRLN